MAAFIRRRSGRKRQQSYPSLTKSLLTVLLQFVRGPSGFLLNSGTPSATLCSLVMLKAMAINGASHSAMPNSCLTGFDLCRLKVAKVVSSHATDLVTYRMRLCIPVACFLKFICECYHKIVITLIKNTANID